MMVVERITMLVRAEMVFKMNYQVRNLLKANQTTGKHRVHAHFLFNTVL